VVRFGDRLSMTWRDVSDRFAATQAIRESEEQYRLLAENSSDVVVRIREGRFSWVSPNLGDALGWAGSAWLGRQFEEFLHPDDVASLADVRVGLAAGQRVVFRVRLLSKGGVYHWAEVHAAPYRDADGRPDGSSASFRVVDAEVRAQRELDRRARFDDLTGLLNRKEVLARIPHVMAHPRRTGDRTAVLFCDIDRLKGLNDQYGHVVGDEVIRTVADRVRASVRNDDLVARLGGDELLVILDGVHGLDDALQVAENIRASVALPMLVHETLLTPTVSVGVTLAAPGEDIDSMIARADDAMYNAKHKGRDRVVAIPPRA
jgi:diguanylate cyclase (GGDEF)-like protein/PAS domain S-box-containing protein